TVAAIDDSSAWAASRSCTGSSMSSSMDQSMRVVCHTLYLLTTRYWRIRQSSPVYAHAQPCELLGAQRPARRTRPRPHESALVQAAHRQPHPVPITAAQLDACAGAIAEHIGLALDRFTVQHRSYRNQQSIHAAAQVGGRRHQPP